MDPEWVIRIVLFSIVHWVLAGFLLHDIANRERVFGGYKPPWVIAILIIPCFGSVLYLLFHPQVLNPDRSQGKNHHDKREK
jgi:hypothetical protein